MNDIFIVIYWINSELRRKLVVISNENHSMCHIGILSLVLTTKLGHQRLLHTHNRFNALPHYRKVTKDKWLFHFTTFVAFYPILIILFLCFWNVCLPLTRFPYRREPQILHTTVTRRLLKKNKKRTFKLNCVKWKHKWSYLHSNLQSNKS